MIQTVVAAVSLLFSATTFASEAPAKAESVSTSTAPTGEYAFARVAKGDWAISSGMSLSYSSHPINPGTSLWFSTAIGHFFFDRFSAGLQLTLERNRSGDFLGFSGVQARYHFWVQDKWSANFKVSAERGLTDDSVPAILSGTLTLEHFFTPSVAFGPYLQYDQYFARYTQWNSATFGAAFGIYL